MADEARFIFTDRGCYRYGIVLRNGVMRPFVECHTLVWRNDRLVLSKRSKKIEAATPDELLLKAASIDPNAVQWLVFHATIALSDPEHTLRALAHNKALGDWVRSYGCGNQMIRVYTGSESWRDAQLLAFEHYGWKRIESREEWQGRDHPRLVKWNELQYLPDET